MSELEEVLAGQLRMMGAPEWVREYSFAKPRRYRFDFAWVEQRVACEVQGGVWLAKGGHNTGAGLQRDYFKLNLAVENGWAVLQFDREAIVNGTAVTQIIRVLQLRAESAKM